MPAIGVIGAIGGALISSRASGKAADSQERASAEQIALQREIYDDTTERFAPYLGAGGNALDAYMFELGLGDRPTFGGSAPRIREVPYEVSPARQGQGMWGRIGDIARATQMGTRYQVGGRTFDTREEAQAFADANPSGGTEYQGFQTTPGYQFQFDQGTDAVNALAGAQGGLNSGRTLQDLTQFGQGLANQEYGGYLNRLAGLTDMGQASAANQASAGNAFANQASNSIAGRGNAQAAGYIGQANAINSGIGNALGAFSYQNNLNPGVSQSGLFDGRGLFAGI